MRLLGTERIRTENNCVPRDIVAGRRRDAVRLQRLHRAASPRRRSTTCSPCTASAATATRSASSRRELPGLLDDPQFQRDFAELYRYYREAQLLQLRRLDGLLLAVFQTGAARRRPQGAALAGRRRRRGDLRGQPRRTRPRLPAVARLRVDADHPRAARPRPAPAHLHRGRGVRRDGRRHAHRQGGEQHRGRRGHLLRAGRRAAAEPRRRGDRVRPDRPADPAARSCRTRRPPTGTWSSTPAPRTCVRLDGIGQACQRLPEDQGIIFPGGYYLATGVAKTFDADTAELEFERVDPLGQRRGRALRLPRPGRRALPAAAVQRDPQGGRHPDHRATATRCSTTAR